MLMDIDMKGIGMMASFMAKVFSQMLMETDMKGIGKMAIIMAKVF